MGDPRRIKNKYETPRKVWDAERIKTEKKLASTYGLKNTREVWIALQHLKKARRNAIRLIALGKEGMEKGKPLLSRLAKLGLLSENATLEDVLSITVENFLDRRLQTRVVKKGLARTMAQARQLITHGFIAIRGRRVTVPSYLVNAEEDAYISYYRPIDISPQEAKPERSAAQAGAQRES
ncbi:MAG: 30S ribosomal protein S4 [Candidatus Micrarchaeota archaeon]|nr:30S ribosomal protein S4 [Candidatus Micrarchaeota archaeon]